MEVVALIQVDAGITGHAGEIGVFHGKLLIALAHMVGPRPKVTAIDVFDDQSKNVDGAGIGSLEKLKDNITLHGPPDADYGFIKADSIAMTSSEKDQIMRDRGPFRLFSVDGCHTLEHTYNDLLTAQEFLSPGGVMILDDMMQPHWPPGVTEAVHQFYARTVPRVKPFLYAYHKLFFVGYGWHAHFLERTRVATEGRTDVRIVQMFGSPIVSIF